MTALTIENLSKYYRLGGVVTELFPSKGQELKALDDVSFTVSTGETVGIIGRNGAGKSTLLKILSRITRPTRGRIEIVGRLASLLEVGTGFHPELSGRENVFLNGAILGMKREEIKKRFDQIVHFSGVERFLDTPVKFYSTGMYIRLAFSIAAHLEPEILVVDEVLAVGDSLFQTKCIGRMKSAAAEGRTVLFVSHAMTAVRQLCTRAILLENGRVSADGPAHKTLAQYNKKWIDELITSETNLSERLQSHTGDVRFTEFHLRSQAGEERTEFKNDEPIAVCFNYQAFNDVSDLVFLFALRSDLTDEVISSSRFVLSELPLKKGHCGQVRVVIPAGCLYAREYHPSLWLGNRSGLAFDRITYSQDSCRPILVRSDDEEFSRQDGYFPLPLNFVHQSL